VAHANPLSYVVDGLVRSWLVGGATTLGLGLDFGRTGRGAGPSGVGGWLDISATNHLSILVSQASASKPLATMQGTFLTLAQDVSGPCCFVGRCWMLTLLAQQSMGS